MPGLWDSKMKQLVGEVPQDFVQWLVQGAQYKEELSPHLSDRNINADVLYSILIEELPYLLHIEFQRRGEKQMAKRVWEYNVLATCKFNSPVYSFVIYLKKDSPIAETPYIWRLHDTQEVHRFHFNVIKLWEIPTETLLTAGFKGLLPLAPLTRDGSQKEVIEEVINRLAPYEETLNRDLLALTYGVAALVFANANDQNWLKWRFGMLEEIINESWAFKEYEQRNQEKWRKEGIERGRKEGLEQGLERGIGAGIGARDGAGTGARDGAGTGARDGAGTKKERTNTMPTPHNVCARAFPIPFIAGRGTYHLH